MPFTSRSISLSIAAPAFNESEGIEKLLIVWCEYLKKLSFIQNFEIVVCNDGSSDETGLILDRLAQSHPEIRPIHFRYNQGAAAALTEAIRHTQYDWVLITDSDGQFPIENLSSMMNFIDDNEHSFTFAQGIRRKKDRFLLRFGSSLSGWLCNFIHGSNIKDFNCAFKLVPGNLMRSLTLEAKGMNYSTEMTSRLLEAGAKATNVSIEHTQRQYGKSHTKLLRDSFHRALFVFYISLRQLLLKMGILRSFTIDNLNSIIMMKQTSKVFSPCGTETKQTKSPNQ